MTDKQIIIDENKINPNDWLEPYKPIPACEIKDCDHLVYAGNDVYGCRIAEDGLVCDDFNNDDECCMYRQLEYYKEALKAKEQECEELKDKLSCCFCDPYVELNDIEKQRKCVEVTECFRRQLDQLKVEVKSKTEYIQEQREIINQYSKEIEMYKKCQGKRASKREEELKAENDELKRQHQADKGLITSTGKMNYQLLQEYDKLKTALTEIKPILEYYANSTIGEEQEDGTYRIELSYKYGSSNMYGAPCYYKYNPKPARQALQKISECEVE